MSKYIRKERQGQIIFVVMIILAIIIGLVWAEIENRQQVPEWPAEVTSNPMANANVSWEQTHHPGPWGGAGNGD